MSKLKVGDIVKLSGTEYIILRMLDDIVTRVKNCRRGQIVDAIPPDGWKNFNWELVKQAKQRKFI